MTEQTRPPESFNEAYAQTPPWDIGRPQPAIVALADRGGVLRAPLLDVGCGTGEHVLFLRSRGIDASGIDIAPAAIERAREKARLCGVDPNVFSIADALALGTLGKRFSTTLDVGVFHIFGDADRVRYAASLAQILEPGGVYVTMAFSDHEPADWGGPRRIREADFASTFRDGWRVRSVEEARFTTHLPQHAASGGRAWVAVVDRVSR